VLEYRISISSWFLLAFHHDRRIFAHRIVDSILRDERNDEDHEALLFGSKLAQEQAMSWDLHRTEGVVDLIGTCLQ